MYEGEELWRDVDRYFIGELVHEDAALAEARASSAATVTGQADVAPNQGAFLSIIAKIAGARRVLEFGTLAGYSAIWLARAVGPEGRVVTLEVDEPTAAIARRNFENAGVAGSVELIVGPAAEVREFTTAMGGNRALEATALQTVGLKGWDGFSIAVVTS